MNTRIHFGSAVGFAACGRTEVRNVTLDRSKVSCGQCRGTVAFSTDHFTQAPRSIPRPLTQRTGKHRRRSETHHDRNR